MLKIVNDKGETATYRGKRLEFLDSERERAETILFLVQREATNGPHSLVEAMDTERDETGAYRVFKNA